MTFKIDQYKIYVGFLFCRADMFLFPSEKINRSSSIKDLIEKRYLRRHEI